MHRPVVDFPQPDSPTRPSVLPWTMSNVTPSIARQTSSPPSTGKCFTRFETRTSASLEVEFIDRRLSRDSHSFNNLQSALHDSDNPAGLHGRLRVIPRDRHRVPLAG